MFLEGTRAPVGLILNYLGRWRNAPEDLSVPDPGPRLGPKHTVN